VNYDQTSIGVGPLHPLLALLYLAAIVFEVAAVWKVFTKAGRPGWGVIIPIYNVYLMIKVAGRPGWWLILYIVPIVNIVIHLIVAVDIARNFGRGAGFGVLGLWLFGFVGFPILGFGRARYQGPRPA
jgi:hypothetical protein